MLAILTQGGELINFQYIREISVSEGGLFDNMAAFVLVADVATDNSKRARRILGSYVSREDAEIAFDAVKDAIEGGETLCDLS